MKFTAYIINRPQILHRVISYYIELSDGEALEYTYEETTYQLDLYHPRLKCWNINRTDS